MPNHDKRRPTPRIAARRSAVTKEKNPAPGPREISEAFDESVRVDRRTALRAVSEVGLWLSNSGGEATVVGSAAPVAFGSDDLP